MSFKDEFNRLVLTMIQRVYPERTMYHAQYFIIRINEFIHASEAAEFNKVFNSSNFTPDIIERFSIDVLANFACYRSFPHELKTDINKYYFEPIHQYAGSDLFVNRVTGKALDEKRMKDLFDTVGKGFRIHQLHKPTLKQMILGSKCLNVHESVLMYDEKFYDNIDNLGSNRDVIRKAISNHYIYTSHMPESVTSPDQYVRKLLEKMKTNGEEGFRNNYKPEFSKTCGHHVLKVIVNNGYKLKNYHDQRSYGEIMATLISDGADWYKGLCTGFDHIDDLRDEELSEDEKLKSLVKIAIKSYDGIDLYGPSLKLLDRESLKRNTPRIHLKKMSEMTGDISFMHSATKNSRRLKIIEDLGI